VPFGAGRVLEAGDNSLCLRVLALEFEVTNGFGDGGANIKCI